MTSRQRQKLIALTCAAMTQHGVVLLLLGPVLPSIMETFRIDTSAAGMMLGLSSLGFALGPLIAGALADRAGVRLVFFLGLATEALVLGLLGMAPSFLLVVAAAFVFGLASAFVETAVNVVPALLQRRQAGSLMNVVHLFFSVGAFVSPFLAGLILKMTGDWRPVFWWAILPTALLALLVLRIPFPARVAQDDGGAASVTSSWALLRERPILLGALALFLYVGAEVGVSSWIVLYLQRKLSFATLASTSGLSILWIGIMVGRYLNSRLARHRSSRELVVGAGVGGLVTGLALLTARTPMMAYVWLGAIGLFMSGVYPNVMAELNGRDPARAGVVTGFLAVGASAGAMVFQPLIGAVAKWIGLSAALALPAILMGVLAVAYLGAVDVKPAPSDEAISRSLP